MGLRSRMRLAGIRLLEKLVGQQPNYHQHSHACRVCLAEQTIRADDHTICASHLLTHLDSLAPSVQVSFTSQPFPSPRATNVVRTTMPTTYYPTSPSKTSTASPSCQTSASSKTAHKIPRKSLPTRKPLPVIVRKPLPATAQSPSFPTTPLCICSKRICECRRKLSSATGMEVHAQYRQPLYSPVYSPRVVEASSLVQSIQCALGNLRYAISGHLAFQLQTSSPNLAKAFYSTFNPKTAFDEMLAVSQKSEVSRPSIVCPRSTLDVLPSWAAASRGQFTFGPSFGSSDSNALSLRINVDGALVKVHIDWVDDEQFNLAPFVVEDLVTTCSSGIVPVLSVSSLINQSADILASGMDLTPSTEAILRNQITLGLQIKEEQGLTVPPAEAPSLYQMDFVKKYCNELIQQSLFDHLFDDMPTPKHIRRKPVPTRSA